jgi:outer membrane protein assembly factor BamA
MKNRYCKPFSSLWHHTLLFALLFSGIGNTCLAQGHSQTPLTTAPQQERYPCLNTKKISAILLSGNKRTRSSVILREMSITEGDLICTDSLETILHLNYQRLYNLNIFTDIVCTATEVDSNTITVSVALKEQWFIIPQADLQLADRNINVWWKEQNHDLDRVNFGLYVQHKNLSGRLDKLSISTHLGYTQQLTLSYYRPYIDRRQKIGLGFSTGYSRSKELAYTTAGNKLLFTRHDNDFLYHNFFSGISFYYRAAYHSRHIVSAAYHQYRVGDTVVQLNSDFFSNKSTELRYLELAYRYEYNGVDNWNYPRKGVKIVANAAFRHRLSGMNDQAVAGLELGLFKKLSDRFYTSFVLRGKSSFLNEAPYFLRTAFGYKSNFVRGYEYYVVEANHFAIGRISLKYEALRRQYHHLPFRYLPELPVWIYPKIFFDAGYASNSKSLNSTNTLANTFLYSFGVGLDIITAYDLKLRIEFAINHLGENGVYLHANSE